MLTRSQYVSINYRLGAFGWLSGPTLQADGVANAGLRDQRFALKWVQQHIAKFGGDPSRVTVFGRCEPISKFRNTVLSPQVLQTI